MFLFDDQFRPLCSMDKVSENNKSWKGKSLLIVEDEYILGAELLEMVGELGYTVVGHAMDKEEAYHLIEEKKPDLVLLDIQLGEEYAGLEIAKSLRYHWDIPFLFLSSHIGKQVIDRAKILQPYGYLVKPVRREILSVKIEMALYKAAYEVVSRQEQERKILLELSTALVSVKEASDLEQVILHSLQAVFSFDLMDIILFQSNDLKMEQLLGGPDPILTIGDRFAIEENPAAAFFRLNEAGLYDLDDIAATYSVKQVSQHEFQSLLCFPLNHKGLRIGVFNLYSKVRSKLEAISLELLQGVTDQIAVAVSNIIANERIRLREKEKTLQIVLRNIFSQQRSWTEKMQSFAEAIHQYIPYTFLNLHLPSHRMADWSNIYLVKGTKGPYAVSERDFNREAGAKQAEMLTYFEAHRKQYLTAQIFQKEDLEKIERDYVYKEKLFRQYGYQSQLIAPFSSDSLRVQLVLMSDASYTYNYKDLAFLMVIAPTITYAIAKRMAYEEIARNGRIKTLQIKLVDSLKKDTNWEAKYLAMTEILQPELPFELIGFGGGGEEGEEGGYLERIGLRDYRKINPATMMRLANIPVEEEQRILAEHQRKTYLLVMDSKHKRQTEISLMSKAIGKYFRSQSHIYFPLQLSNGRINWISLYSRKANAFSEEHIKLLQEIQTSIILTLDRLIAYQKIEKLSQQLRQEKEYLQEEIKVNYNFGEMVGNSPALQSVLNQVSQVSDTTTTVLITGESGTGKELIARAIHNNSSRSKKPLVKLNCAALPPQLLESELFGHEKGSFTGASQRRIGKFEIAHKGTIFLDEIGEMPIELQAKLLRVLQEKEFERLGSNRVIKSDIRIIAATNRDLEKAVANRNFRTDLFFRLNVFPIHLPALRERRDDILPLAQHFLKRAARNLGKSISGLSDSACQELMAYDWPGNIRELEHVIERAVILNTGDSLELALEKVQITLPPGQKPTTKFVAKTLNEAEKELILYTLKFCQGRIRGEGGAAQLLAINPNTLDSRMKKLGIVKEHVLRDLMG